MSAAQKTVPVSEALLDSLEDRLCDVSEAIAAVAETMSSKIDPSHIQFVSEALTAALADKLARCFDAMSAGALLRSERHLLEVAHAARA
jgi:hypothetical protein